MAEDETTTGSGDHGATGAGGSTSGSTATGDMGLEALLALVAGVEDSGLATVLDELQAAENGWIGGTPGGAGRDDWSADMRYGYFHYEDNVRTYELINNPDSGVRFADAFQALRNNVAKVASDNGRGSAPGDPIRRPPCSRRSRR